MSDSNNDIGERDPNSTCGVSGSGVETSTRRIRVRRHSRGNRVLGPRCGQDSWTRDRTLVTSKDFGCGLGRSSPLGSLS